MVIYKKDMIEFMVSYSINKISEKYRCWIYTQSHHYLSTWLLTTFHTIRCSVENVWDYGQGIYLRRMIVLVPVELLVDTSLLLEEVLLIMGAFFLQRCLCQGVHLWYFCCCMMYGSSSFKNLKVLLKILGFKRTWRR